MNIINLQMNNIYPTMKGKNIDSLSRIGYTALCMGMAAVTKSGDVFVKREGASVKDNSSRYDYNSLLHMLDTDFKKNIYLKCTENINEPEYVKYDYNYPEEELDICEYTFYDKKGRTRKKVVMTDLGVVSSMTLYNEEEKPFYKVHQHPDALGRTTLTKLFLDILDEENVIKKEEQVIS